MNIIITGRGVKVTAPIKSKVEDMLSKHKKLLEKAGRIEVELKQNIAHGGVKDDLSVEVTVAMSKVFIRVEESGSDFYVIIDKVDPILRRRLVRFRDQSKKWEGTESWKSIEREQFEKEVEESHDDTYADSADFEPVITRNKQYSRNSPMHPAEAIERMELLGHEAFMFKNTQTGNYSMVYKRNDGTYGLVEPKDS